MNAHHADHERVAQALAYVPVGGHDDRVRIAFALKSELGDEGFSLWDDWYRSGRGDSYDAAESRSVYKSAKPGGAVTIATLFHEAKQRGWAPGPDQRPSPEDLEQRRRIAEVRAAKAAAEDAKRHEEARARAVAIWTAAKSAPPTHAYLRRKKIKPHPSIRLFTGNLVVPVYVDDVLTSLQLIDSEGGKVFLPGSRTRGGHCLLGEPKDVIVIAEGFATASSIHEATGLCVVVAFNAGNLGAAARAFRTKYPGIKVIVAADDDAGTLGNPGLSKATEAALAVGGLLAVPDFGDNRPEGASDFNDLAQARGPEAVRACIEGAAHVDGAGDAHDSHGWPELLPLVAESSSTPYPIDALPGAIGAAVRDVVGFVQCPPALAACSALSALSLVGQGLADVRRTEGLTGPCSLFILAIADSGERKTTCDGFFLSSLRAWEAAQIEGAKPDQAQHAADLDAWEAQRDGLRLKIKENSRKDHASEAEGRELRELELGKPTPPRVPRLLYVEATPEALAFKLATVWPSAGVLSSEAGIVFGGHGNRSESVMRNLAQLNVLWDGGMLPIDRRTSESFVVRGARLTMGLAVQPDTVRTFLEATKGLARGSGFAARFLIAWPASTQGYRPFKDAPEKWPGLSAFHRRIEELLRLPLPITEAGTLEPTVLPLDPKAKAAWVGFADDVEIELRPGGDMEKARDVASKAADNVARLAALFHIFEHGPVGAVGVDHVLAAATIVGWHLYEARRFLGEMALPVEAVNAARLESWLVDKCRSERLDGVSTRDVMRMGPNPTRARKALDAAVAELVEAGRVRLVQEGRRRWVEVRPELLKGGGHGTP